MMLSLTLTLLLADDDINDVNNVNNVDNVNDVDNVNADNANDKKRRKSSIEEEKESRLDISLDRIERLVMCCFFASLAVNQTKSTSEFALSKD
jgi:hypothetical protein